jgi:hypothetical protein
MALTRGSFNGYEFDRMVILFSMIDGERTIPCAISTSAMDDLEKVQRVQPEQREMQFMRLRDRIERRAAEKFVAREFEGTPPGIILRSLDFRNGR